MSALSYLTAVFLAFAAVSCGHLGADARGYRSERDLKRDLFRDYDKSVRPVRRATNTVPLSFGISPIRILELNEKKQVLVLDAWIRMKWTDSYLSWDPEEFDNITILRLPATEVWKPDIALYTGTPDVSLFPSALPDVILYNNGDVMWVPPFTIRSRCPLVNRTPKPTLTCDVKFGSWTYSGPMVDIQLYNAEKVELRDFEDTNLEWKLVDVVAERESKRYPCCVEEYPSVQYNFTLKRRSPYFEANSAYPGKTELNF